eukprot:892652-Pyramimonas_sp.AAC.1
MSRCASASWTGVGKGGGADAGATCDGDAVPSRKARAPAYSCSSSVSAGPVCRGVALGSCTNDGSGTSATGLFTWEFGGQEPRALRIGA